MTPPIKANIGLKKIAIHQMISVIIWFKKQNEQFGTHMLDV
jgi:hypothetical protein